MLKVICIDNEGWYNGTLLIDEIYNLDEKSISVDQYGVTYGKIYGKNDEYIGNLNLSRFKFV